MRYTTTALFLLAMIVLSFEAAPARADQTGLRPRVAQQLQRLRDGFEAPGRTVAEAARNLQTPERALAFVRDEIGFVPYRGSWHDAEATLRLRVANATDKALLLQSLLQAMDQETRLVRAPWPTDARPVQRLARSRPTSALEALRKELAPTRLESTAGADRARLAAEVARARRVIETLLARNGLAERFTGTPPATRTATAPQSWAWVQRRLQDGSFEDLDPTLPHRARPAVGATAFAPKRATAMIRVLAGTKALLTWKGDAATLFEHDAQVLFVPSDKDPKAAENPGAVASWRPRLQVGPQQVAGDAFATQAAQAAPAPAFGGLGGLGRRRPAPKRPEGIRLEVGFVNVDEATPYRATFGRDILRFDEGFDPQQLVSVHRIAAGVGLVPHEVTVARQIDELLDLNDLRQGVKLADWKQVRAERGLSARTARVLNALGVVLPGLLSQPVRTSWQGPAVVVESVSLATAGNGLEARTRIDIWHQAFGPANGTPRLQRLEWGLAALALEGYLVRGTSVNQQLAKAPEGLQILDRKGNQATVRGDEVAAAVLGEGGLVLHGAHAEGMTWSLRPSGDLLGTLRSAGTIAKGGETRSQAAGRGFAALGGAALGTLGSPAGMLVGGIAAYLGELAKAYEGAAGVLDALGDTIETGDDRHILEAIGKYRADFAQQMTRALAEGLVRGYAEAALSAGIGHALPGTGSAVGDRLVDGAIAGGLAYPQDLPVISDVIHAAAERLMR
jgi:hypothetical protein